MNETLNVIYNRRSVRKYADRPIGQPEKDAILKAAFRAPTAGNMMLYSIIEVEDQALKERLVETCDHQPFIAKAPLLLVFLADYQRWVDIFEQSGAPERSQELGMTPRLPQEGDLMLAVEDTMIAAQNAVIAAESLGIGSCYIGDILENFEIHRELFNLPQFVLPISMLCFGYPFKPPSGRLTPRFDPEFIVHKNQYQRLDQETLQRMMSDREERFTPTKKADNFGQAFYQRKFVSDFSVEMSRSVRAMLGSWCKTKP